MCTTMSGPVFPFANSVNFVLACVVSHSGVSLGQWLSNFSIKSPRGLDKSETWPILKANSVGLKLKPKILHFEQVPK
jgi:hypothetical protein